MRIKCVDAGQYPALKINNYYTLVGSEPCDKYSHMCKVCTDSRYFKIEIKDETYSFCSYRFKFSRLNKLERILK